MDDFTFEQRFHPEAGELLWQQSASDLVANNEIINEVSKPSMMIGKLKWKILQQAWFAVLAASGSLLTAQNLAINPGFETGNTTGWIAFGAPSIAAQSSQVHSGNYAAMVQNRTATWNGIAQSFQTVLQPGGTYQISAWVRLVVGVDQTVQLTMQRTDGGGTAYTLVASGNVSASGWTRLSGQYTLSVSGSLTALNLYAEVPSSASASYYLDDLEVMATESVPAAATIVWNDVRQVIDGFGASSAWRSTWSTAQANMFFGTNSGTGQARDGTTYQYTGIGLSLLRTRIAPGGTTVEQTIMQLAQARGARVWSSPWSPAPAAQFKSNTNVNGGSFIGNTTNYQAYASQLARYVVNMKNQYGVDLYALSIQNEPDANVTTYESCNWTAQQIHDFIPHLSAALTASNVAATKIMLPESQNWTDPQGLRLTTMNDPATAALVGIIANHNYVANNAAGDQNPPAALNNYGKALWETEVAKLSGDDSSIGDGLYWAGRVHQFLTVAQANAWHYWWLCAYGTSNEGLCDTNDVPAKRLYALGNFSRFVRPGFRRIGISNATGPLQVSAFKNSTNGNFAIVVINPTATNVSQTFQFDGFSVATAVTPWLTSASASLVAQPTVVINGSVFTNLIPAQSIVTFTGQAAGTNSPPSFAGVSSFSTNAGFQLSITNIATDADVPAQMLTFDLLVGPPNATLNTTNGVLSWRPLVNQASTTNMVRVKVSDSGTPSLSATNNYVITINPLSQPRLESISLTASQVSLMATGALGPDYLLLGSTNLVYWQTLWITNPMIMPWQFSTTNSGAAQYFYRLQLAP